jgi:hypothetical protein
MRRGVARRRSCAHRESAARRASRGVGALVAPPRRTSPTAGVDRQELARMIRAAVVLLAGAAYTNCQYFTNVVVPANATQGAPAVWSGVYDFSKGGASELDNYDVLVGTDGTFDFAIPDPTLAYLAVAAGTDSGGVQTVQMASATFTATCVVHLDGPRIRTFPVSVDITDTVTQAGGVGSTVSNGAYDSVEIDFSNSTVDLCGFVNQSVIAIENPSVTWTTIATDYHGNRTAGRPVRVHYDGSVQNVNWVP